MSLLFLLIYLQILEPTDSNLYCVYASGFSAISWSVVELSWATHLIKQHWICFSQQPSTLSPELGNNFPLCDRMLIGFLFSSFVQLTLVDMSSECCGSIIPRRYSLFTSSSTSDFYPPMSPHTIVLELFEECNIDTSLWKTAVIVSLTMVSHCVKILFTPTAWK